MQPQPWIKARVKELRKSLKGLGEAMGNLDGSRITEIMAGTRRVQLTEVEPMARFLEMTYQDVYDRLFGTAPESRPKSVSHPLATTRIDTSATVLVPLWQARETGGLGSGVFLHLVRSDSWAAAPAELRLIKDALAVQYWSDDNLPWLKRGSTLFVIPSSKAREGDCCILAVEFDPIAGTITSPRAGMLLGGASTSSAWKLRQGAKDVLVSKTDWPLNFKVEWIKP
jgi:hypothetical protein